MLAACGGGGDDTDLSDYLSPYAPPAPVAIAVLSGGFALPSTILADTAALLATAKYQNTPVGVAWLQQYFDPGVPDAATQDPLRTSGAALAHAAGLTGAGQLIAISDEHLSPTHESIAGRVTIDSNAAGSEHGTAVASVAAGNAAGFVGTAPGANLLFGSYGSDQDLADLGQRALSMGAVAWNNSWGYTNLGLSQSDFDIAFNGGVASQNYLAALDAYAAQGVVVFSVSNDSLNTATLMDGLPYLRPGLEAGWIAAANGVPTYSGSEITAVHLISNACWQAARWCLVADGTWNAATGPWSGYEPVTGSSFSSPQISGALALLAEAFPTLTPHELRIRLLASAADDFFVPDDTVELASGFFKGYSVIYGMGYLDIAAALRPIGGTAMTLAEGGTISTDAPVLETGSAFGDAVERSLQGMDISVHDALAAGFVMPGEALAAGNHPGAQAERLLAKSLRSNLSADRLASPGAGSDPFAAFDGPVLSMASGDGTVSAAVLLPQYGSGSSGLTVRRALIDGPTRLDIGVKIARDDGQLTSLDRDNAALMASVTMGLTQEIGRAGFVALSGEIGQTDLGGSTAFGATGLARFDAVKLTAGQSDFLAKGDRISIGIGLPVAIASGTTEVNLPVIREGRAAFDAVSLDLSPEQRQVDLDVTYQAQVADGLEMKLSVIRSENFGNRAGETDSSGALAFAFRF